MNQIFNVIGVLILIAIAFFGCLLIFGVIGFESAGGNFVKVVAAIALLGGCSAVLAILMNRK